MLVVAVISVDAYPFLAFSGLTCHLEDVGVGVFGCTVPSDIKETELGSSDQEASPAAGKNTGVVLVPCSCMEVHPYSCFQRCGLVSHEFTVYLSIFNLFKLDELWSYYQKHVNQIILNCTTL